MCNICHGRLNSEVPTMSSVPSLSPTVRPTSVLTGSPSVGPSTAPTRFPTGSPFLTPTLVPSFHPTISPSRTPTNFPTSLAPVLVTPPPTARPSLFPTHAPTAAPTTTCSGGVDAEMTDMKTGSPLSRDWLEIGFADVSDQAWVVAHTALSTFSDVSVFVSSPDTAGYSSVSGFPAIARVRNVKVSSGVVSFEVRLYQANDSFCSKEWLVPSALRVHRVSWLVSENGAFQLSGNRFIVGNGPIVRFDNGGGNNFVRFDYPTGCPGDGPCWFDDVVNPGAIVQLQTVVYDRLLIPRALIVAKKFARFMLQPHDSTDASYFVMTEPETLGYMAFKLDVFIVCAEGWSVETRNMQGMTSDAMTLNFAVTFATPPGVFGMVATSTSLSESTSVRTYDVTAGRASVLAQEDQCVDEETIHTTPEVFHMLVIGRGGSSTMCNICHGFMV